MQQRSQIKLNTNLLLIGAAGLILTFLAVYTFDSSALFENLSFKLAKNSPITRPLTFIDSLTGVLIGIAIAAFLPLRFVLPAALGLVIAIVVTVTQVKLPFKFLPGDFMLALAAAATYAAGVRFRVETAHNVAIEAMVRGTLPQPVVEQIVKSPASFNLSDREVSTSVLAIHIVGFSTISEKFPADQFFPNMRAIYRAMAQNVHMFGGVLDRSFRDGFLAYFGDNMLVGSATQNHADMALQCAVQIQKANIGIILEADKFNKPVFALKCGIHSGRGYVGNLGDASQVNMSLVGRVVDTAAACATACEAHSIMFTKTTHDLLVKIDRGSPLFISRYMHIRNEEEMVKVIEFDPLRDSQDFRRQVMQALRKCAELERKGKRFDVKRTDYYQLRVNNGPAQLVNVSNGGIGVKLEKGFALGTEVQVLIQTTDEVLNRRLQYRNLNKVSGEVRWSKQQGSMYITGIQLKSLKADNTEFLLQAILDADRASA